VPTWDSTISLSGCSPGCCGGGSCPCDTTLFPSTLHGTITRLTGTCTAMDGTTFTMTHTGGNIWDIVSSTGACFPMIGSLNCMDVGGGVYKFRIFFSFGADLSFFSYHTSYACSPVDIIFNPVDLIWSGVNGDSLCCPQSDTGSPTVIGTFKIEITP